LIICLLIAYVSINYQFSDNGLIINGVEFNSTAALAGIQNPGSKVEPTQREQLLKIGNTPVRTIEEYATATEKLQFNTTVHILTDKKEYVVLKQNESIGIIVAKAPSSNLRKGLDLQGGTRALLKPIGKVTASQLNDIIATMENRLNVYGVSDVTIKSASDLSGDKFIVVEIAGATKEEVKELIASQGKFEAKIGNQTVFEGGRKDITFVCRNDGTCSRITNCGIIGPERQSCRFEFEIALSAEAADHHAEITKNMTVNRSASGSEILEKPLELYLDGRLVSSLQIDASLRGQKATRVVISGPGFGATQKEAVDNAVAERNKLQTVLITGSLPTKLEIVKIDSISPTLGEEFIKNAFFIGFLGMIAVSLVIFLRYRSQKIVIPIMITVISEVTLTLGIAAIFKYNLDLAAIAGIIAAVGTGVDDQVVIIDEILLGEGSVGINIKQKIKKAFFVILAAYVVTVAAMLPLLRAGAGLLTGFAFTTIIGVTVGVFITRPAFAAMMRVLMEE
ncbi:hypothetical protein HZB00_02230, partial [Candidatus Woesearchaeota archaeon]|nr:hypothetical protein [Candidatus Woesearchaeota archaeon]